MFALFYSLYVAMFTGTWTNYTWANIKQNNQSFIDGLGTFVTSIFGDNNYTTLGQDMFYNQWNLIYFVSLILALITSIGIVVMAVKGVKKAFGIFFMGIR